MTFKNFSGNSQQYPTSQMTFKDFPGKSLYYPTSPENNLVKPKPVVIALRKKNKMAVPVEDVTACFVDSSAVNLSVADVAVAESKFAVHAAPNASLLLRSTTINESVEFNNNNNNNNNKTNNNLHKVVTKSD